MAPETCEKLCRIHWHAVSIGKAVDHPLATGSERQLDLPCTAVSRAVRRVLSGHLRCWADGVLRPLRSGFDAIGSASSGYRRAASPALLFLSSAKLSKPGKAALSAIEMTHDPHCPTSTPALASAVILTTAAAATSSSMPPHSHAVGRETGHASQWTKIH